MGKISVDAFLREYGVANKQKGSAIENFLKKHITTQYIDFIKKDVYCDKIISASCYIKQRGKEIIKINSNTRYLFFIMRLIELYTDIELNQENIVGDYDKLNEVGAIDLLIASIPEKEYTEFSTLLNMKMDDFRDNEYSITAFLYNLKESFNLSEEVVDSVIKELTKETETDE